MISSNTSSDDEGLPRFIDRSAFARADRLSGDYYDERLASELLGEANLVLSEEERVEEIEAERKAYRRCQAKWLRKMGYVLLRRHEDGEQTVSNLVLSSLGIKVLPFLDTKDLEKELMDDVFFQPFKFTGVAVTPLPSPRMAELRENNQQTWSRPMRSATFPDFVKDALDPWADLYGIPDLDKLWQAPCSGECATMSLEELKAIKHSHPRLGCGVDCQPLALYCAVKRVDWFLASFGNLDGFTKDTLWQHYCCLCFSAYCHRTCIVEEYLTYGVSVTRDYFKSVAFLAHRDRFHSAASIVPHTGVLVCSSIVSPPGEVQVGDVIAALNVLRDLLEYDTYAAHHTLPVIVFSFQHDRKATVMQAQLTGHRLALRRLRSFDFEGVQPSEGAYDLLKWMANTPRGQTAFEPGPTH